MPFDHRPPIVPSVNNQPSCSMSTDSDVSFMVNVLPEASDTKETSSAKSDSSEYFSETFPMNPVLNNSTSRKSVSKNDIKADKQSPNVVIPPVIILSNEDDTSQDMAGKVIQSPYPYGVGLDVHNLFIVVTVLVQENLNIIAYTKEFDTSREGIQTAYFWAVAIIEENAFPAVEIFPLHYCLESTATMHFPIIKIWGGNPAVVNPTLAKAGRRKTDVIDSIQLARFDMNGVWPRTFIISDEIHALRVLINERAHFQRLATQSSNRIMNTLTRFGCTLCREGRVTSDDSLRSILEGIIAENPDQPSDFCPTIIPEEVRRMLREELTLYDDYRERSLQYTSLMMTTAHSMIWETGKGSLSGDEIIALLMTTPQIGELTAVVFLANIITPRRFPNAKALAAYCGLDPSVQVSAGKKTSKRGRGGNKSLHTVMTAAANRLLSNHNEMIGRWGYNLTQKGTSRNKARNAIARRLAVAMYYMLKSEQPFSYEGYTLANNIVLLNIPVEDLLLLNKSFKRYIPILLEEGIHTSAELIKAYLSCSLDHIDGLGPKFFSIVKDLLENQKKYKRLYEELIQEDSEE